jgi:hypothetical protein
MDGDLVRVYACTSIMEGEIVKARLEAEGIPVLLRGANQNPYRTGSLYVWVPVEFEPQARLLLDATSADEDVPAEDGVDAENPGGSGA